MDFDDLMQVITPCMLDNHPDDRYFYEVTEYYYIYPINNTSIGVCVLYCSNPDLG
jgi:hypothetical protein